MIAYVGFATFRGLLDVVTPLKVSLISQAMNVILDPIFIFYLNLGVKGAALATCAAEVTAAFLYARLLGVRKIVKWTSATFWTSPPSLKQLAPLLAGGAGVLSRSIAMNAAFLAVTRATQSIDAGGAAAAAHTIAMTTWQLGGVVLFALSAVASIVVPSTLNAPPSKGGGPVSAKRAAERMMGWGFVAGLFLAAAQLASLPLLQLFTPVKEVLFVSFLSHSCLLDRRRRARARRHRRVTPVHERHLLLRRRRYARPQRYVLFLSL